MTNKKIKSLLGQNSKMKKTSEYFNTRLFNWNLPAYKSKQGKVICPFANG